MGTVQRLINCFEKFHKKSKYSWSAQLFYPEFPCARICDSPVRFFSLQQELVRIWLNNMNQFANSLPVFPQEQSASFISSNLEIVHRHLNSDNIQYRVSSQETLKGPKKREIPITSAVFTGAKNGWQPQRRLCAREASSQQLSCPTANKAQGIPCSKFFSPYLTCLIKQKRCAKKQTSSSLAIMSTSPALILTDASSFSLSKHDYVLIRWTWAGHSSKN